MNPHLQNNSESEKNDAVAIPTDLLIDLRERSLKFVSDFSQSDEPVRKSISELTRISWEEIFMKTVHQLNTYWKEVGTEISGKLSGVLFFWDDTEGDTGLSACFTTDNNDPDDLLNEFDGGESTVDFDFVFSKIVPAYEEYEEAERIHFRLRNDLLDLIFEKAVAYSLTQTDFLKIKKMDPLYIYRAYAHDDNPPGLMSKVGKNKPKVLDAKGFIKRRILKDHPYFSQIFDTEEWAEQYQDKFREISQSGLAETLDLFLFTYLKENSKPEYIRAIAERLPRSPKTVTSNRLALVLAGYFANSEQSELALQHLRILKKEEHLPSHFLWAREYLSLLEENPEFKSFSQWVQSPES
ncbi:hypothetical protein [Leptospira santarosai]|uniref:hypothetical protein n=1 Tax=Leptospira santarosai TaxID=28183 RepID=UPI00062D5F62|nr:hypothetical protein [Leptospira santarosai]AVV78859.1 Uncharacterized protein XB15_01073 [Leptospira santarosai]ONF86099.1 hypothetical protein BWD13_11520 [Leptospira santarosai serovar Grippotyphosa]